MRIEVLLSCMNQSDVMALVHNINIQTDAVVVNQTDHNSQETEQFVNSDGETCTVRIFNTTERGLSKSRNLALRNSRGDICIICDDDEKFDDQYHKVIEQQYVSNPGFSVLCFEIRNRISSRNTRNNAGIFQKKQLNRISIFKICSIQITFRRQDVVGHNIHFNEKLGAGVSNAGGEEHKFLADCLRTGLKILNVPEYMTTIDFSESSWWKGYSKEYFLDKGISTRLSMGLPLASVYAVYTLVFKHKHYKSKCSFGAAAKSLFKGVFTKLDEQN